jgi:hypothetical protein
VIQRSGDWWYRSAPVEHGTEEFDLQFWQSQGPQAIFAAAWELLQIGSILKGEDPRELRLDKSAHSVQPMRD